MNNEKKFWLSSNFYVNLIAIIGGLFAGWQTELGQEIVTQFIGIIASGKLVQEFIKSKPKFDAKEAVNRSNWWSYISMIIVSIVPTFSPEAVDSLRELTQNLVNGNFQPTQDLLQSFYRLQIMH